MTLRLARTMKAGLAALALAALLAACGGTATPGKTTRQVAGHASASEQQQRHELLRYIRFTAGTASIVHSVNRQQAAETRAANARPFNQLAVYRTAALLSRSTAAYLQQVHDEEPHGTGAVGQLDRLELQFAQDLHAAYAGLARALRTGNNRLFLASGRGAIKAGHLGIRVGNTAENLYRSLGGKAAFAHVLSVQDLRELEAAG